MSVLKSVSAHANEKDMSCREAAEIKELCTAASEPPGGATDSEVRSDTEATDGQVRKRFKRRKN